jgi:tetraacyldisaccharide 4'-kinase
LSDSWEQYGLRVMSGQQRGIGAAILRTALRTASPLYALAMRARNARYDRGRGVTRLPRPVLSVGNITTGGTGKTPVVRWLCDRLRNAGQRPAVLLRGYRKQYNSSDEEELLRSALNGPNLAPIQVHADPDRCAGGQTVLADHPEVSVLVMDDGFQHRRLARDFDLVLIDASHPFGFDRVLPAGLLREPIEGLKRADAILLTHADPARDLDPIIQRLRTFNPSAPIFRCTHQHTGLRSQEDVLHRTDALRGMKVFLFAGIGNPDAFREQFPNHVGHHWFNDHWSYRADDLRQLQQEAEQAGADLLVTTEKDWVKIVYLMDRASAIPIWRAELALNFEGDDETRLLQLIQSRLKSPKP